MIKIENREQDLKIIGSFYRKGFHFLGINTFEEYEKKKRRYPYILQNPGNLPTNYLRYDSKYEITGEEYLNTLRSNKLRKILG